MKNLKISQCAMFLACVLSLAGVSRSSADFGIAAPMPDLKIMQIAENGNLAWVQVKNIGTGNAPACKMRVWYLQNGMWPTNNNLEKNVPALAPGASVWVQFNDPGIAQAFNYYKVDSLNQVVELKESNNGVYIPYGPAG